MGQNLDIAIVGAGIGGLTAASLISALGHRVTIFDEAEIPRYDGPGLLIPPAALPVLARLGIDEAAISSGARINAIRGVEGATGAEVFNLSFTPGGRGTEALALHHASLLALLHDEAEARGVQFEMGKRVLAAATSGDPYLRIEGGTQAGPFDYLIDAGGRRSALSPLVVRRRRFGTVWATVPLPDGETDLGNTIRHRYGGARRMAAVMPIGTLPGESVPQAAVFWSLEHRALAQWQERGFEAFQQEVASFWPDLGELVGGADPADFGFSDSYQGGLTWPATRRIARIGDAAHQGSPLFAPGAALAMLDALVLSDTIAAHGTQGTSWRYVAKRRLHVMAYQGLSRLATPLFQSRFGFMATLRNSIVAPVMATSVMERPIAATLCGHAVPATFTRGTKTPPVRPMRERPLGEPGE